MFDHADKLIDDRAATLSCSAMVDQLRVFEVGTQGHRKSITLLFR